MRQRVALHMYLESDSSRGTVQMGRRPGKAGLNAETVAKTFSGMQRPT